MPKLQVDKKLEKAEVQKEGQEEFAANVVSKQDSDTRQNIAKKFVRYYFNIMILIIVGVPIYNYLMSRSGSPQLVISIKDALLTYSAVVGPTIGLVMAYYFKSKSD